MPPWLQGLCALLVLLLLAPAQLRAQEYEGQKLVQASLVFDSTAAVPGQTVQVGVLLKMAPKWHTYWQYPGDSGEATHIEWTLPEGVTVSPIQWPLPERYVDAGNIETYVFHDEVLLSSTLTVGEDFAGDKLEISAKVSWLVCKQLCLDGGAEVAASLPVVKDLDAVKPTNEKLYMYWQQRVPTLTALSAMPLEEFEWAREGKKFSVKLTGLTLPEGTKLEFFPNPPTSVVLDHPSIVNSLAGSEATITMEAFSAPDDVKEIPGLLVATLPEGEVAPGWNQRQAWVLTRLSTSEFGENEDAESIADKLSAASGGANPTSGSGSGTTADGSANVAAPGTGGTLLVSVETTPPAVPGLLYALWLAFIGGLLLNVMPCVLPAISLKIMGFIQDANEEPRKVAMMGLAFTAGVFTFFMGFAALSVALTAGGQTLGWGMHFQYPIFVAGMSILLVLFALNLFGVFEVALPGKVMQGASSAAQHSGFAGAYLHGLLATLLATACTAPVMGAALGATLGQPAYYTFSVLAMLALGMSTPYLLLAIRPQWLRFLPRPGPWMEAFKQFMGFLLLATVIWLLWVYAGVAGEEAVFWLLLALLGVAAGMWFFGIARPAARTEGGRTFGAVMAALLLMGSAMVLWQRGGIAQELDGKPSGNFQATFHWEGEPRTSLVNDEVQWMPWSPAAVEQGIADGRIVFIDFTARWCTNCIANKRLVLDTEPIKEAFLEKNVLALRADWTRRDEETRQVINSYGRLGIPLNVVYGPGLEGGKPLILPETLTQGAVQDALRKAAGTPGMAAR